MTIQEGTGTETGRSPHNRRHAPMIVVSVVLLLCTASCWPRLSAAGSSPRNAQKIDSSAKKSPYLCRRANHPITIDGKLDEPDWQRADKLTGFLVPPEVDWQTLSLSKPHPAASRTTARLLWDDSFLYFSAEMQDLDLYSSHEGHDPPFGGEDVAELFVKPSRGNPGYWELHVTPSGATRDYFYARRNAGGDDRWLVYESGMQAAVSLRGTLNNWEDRDEGWTVEMAVPMSAFEKLAGKPKAGDRWSFLVSRYDYSVHLETGVELSAAAPLPIANFHLFEHYPDMVFAD